MYATMKGRHGAGSLAPGGDDARARTGIRSGMCHTTRMARTTRDSTAAAAGLAARLRAQAVAEFEAAEDLSSPDKMPTGAIYKLILSNGIAPTRNAQSVLKSLQAILEYKQSGAPGQLPPDLEREVQRIMERQERPRRRRVG